MSARRSIKKQVGLRSKPEGKHPWARLPFVGKDHGEQSCWDVPMSGGYWGGVEAGEAMARVYLKYLRDSSSDPDAPLLLRSVLEGMNKKLPGTKEESQSIHGQRVGFMREIGSWLVAAAQRLGSSFDAIPERSFVRQANEALEKTDAAFMAAINAADRKAKVQSALKR